MHDVTEWDGLDIIAWFGDNVSTRSAHGVAWNLEPNLHTIGPMISDE
jgi:hypothetical protein